VGLTLPSLTIKNLTDVKLRFYPHIVQ
jgi:hypothetical protein